jgi:UDP-glucose 4-epimerase
VTRRRGDLSVASTQRPTTVITGAAGFIGSHLAARLVELGWFVCGVDNGQSGDWNHIAVPVERIDRDLTSLSDDELVSLLDGVDALFHLAAEKHNSSGATPQRTIDVNISATRRLFDAAARAGVGKVVFTSSLYAYGRMGPEQMAESDLPVPRTVYGMSKVAGEHLLRVAARDHGLRFTVARVFFVYGPRQFAGGGYKSVIPLNFERISRGERPVVFGDGEQALDYVYVDDCVEALLAMLPPEHDGGTYNVCTGRAISINTLTRAMLVVAGSDLEPVSQPPDWTAGTSRAGSPTLADQGLAWRATTPIEEGLARVWQWLADESAPELAGASSR